MSNFVRRVRSLSHFLGAACAVAIFFPTVLVSVGLLPRIWKGEVEGSTNHVLLFDAFLFFALAAPVTGILSMILNALIKRALIRRSPTLELDTIRRTTRIAVAATLSGFVWFVLFPFVFFATGGSR